MKILVVYYSRTGNNAYLAEKLATDLRADCERIRTRTNVLPFLLLGFTGGVKALTVDVSTYSHVLIVGPVWMGRLIAPLRGFIKKYRAQFKQVYFITACGSSPEKKNERFGYGHVFNEVQGLLGSKLAHTAAFPTSLAIDESQQAEQKNAMEIRLNDDTFNYQLRKRYEDLLDRFKPIASDLTIGATRSEMKKYA